MYGKHLLNDAGKKLWPSWHEPGERFQSARVGAQEPRVPRQPRVQHLKPPQTH